MKKSLFAVAVFGAFAGAAAAQSNVTIYGLVDTGISYADNGAATDSRTLSMLSGIQSSSRIGFRGTEDLGGGLSALFQLENGFNTNNGSFSTANTLFDRTAVVGLKSGFGTVKLGRQYAPTRTLLDSIDPFRLGLAGNAERHFNSRSRTSNTINYTSPTFSGFTGELAYTFGEVAGDNSANSQFGLSARYKNGPIGVGIAYHKANGSGATLNQSNKTTLLGGTYDFGVAKAHAAYAWNKGDVGAFTSGALQDSRDWMLGVSAPFGAHTFLASYQKRTDKRNVAASADSHTWALAYTYALSKRTNLYTSYSRTTNSDGSNISFSRVNTPAAANGLDPSWFNVGVRHTF